MWKQARKDPRIWRRLIALDFVLGFSLLVMGWQDGGFWLWIGVACLVQSLVLVALYLTRRLRVPYG